METASCSSLQLVCCLHFSTNKCFFHNHFNPNKHLSNLNSPSPLSSTFLKNYNFLGKCLQHNAFTAFSSSSTSTDQNPSPEFALLFEVDGVLIDAYRLGNRQAFNAGFRKLGLDCANWTEPIYKDLLKKGAGDEEKMLTLFFNRIGWPTSLPTSEQGAFVKKVLQEKKIALEEFMASKDSPLRPGVEVFIDEANSKGLPVIILTAYGKIEEKVARSIVDKLGEERITKVKIIGSEEVEQSLYGQLVRQRLLSGLDDELAKEATKAASAEKQRIANEVASMLKLKVEIDTNSSKRIIVNVNTHSTCPFPMWKTVAVCVLLILCSLTNAIYLMLLSLDKIIPALRAGAEYARVPIKDCVLIAGSHYGVAGAGSIGMPCVVLRSSLTARAQFPSADAVMDGFGGADLTVSRLQNKRWL